MVWAITLEPTFAQWLKALDDDSRKAIGVDIETLKLLGPQLGRPTVDTLKGSKFDNMKELRTNSQNHVYRCAFAFDLRREARLLVGGNKQGVNQRRFYADLIKQADMLFEQHLVRQRAELRAESDAKAETKAEKKRRRS
jgi:hypothetical protein